MTGGDDGRDDAGRGGGSRGRRLPGRGLRPEEQALWERLVRGVQPLPGRRLADSKAAARARQQKARRTERSAQEKSTGQRQGGGAGTAAGGGGGQGRRQAAAAAAQQPSAARQRRLALQQGGTLDRRTRQRLVRGQIGIEARLDLHGFGVEEARTRLRGFIVSARQRGLRTVLVITGKGGGGDAPALTRHTLHGYDFHHAPERGGRLRQLLPEWLAEADLAEHVAGWQPAHPRHGGGGAFYVRLRRLRRD